ncbi:hypothetical protein Elgi_68880 [Paenibacillus elgii]|nr:hypothetical protein Elgi_68880 [Paenibacillus elgii]
MASFFYLNCPEGVSSKYRLIVFDNSKRCSFHKKIGDSRFDLPGQTFDEFVAMFYYLAVFINFVVQEKR